MSTAARIDACTDDRERFIVLAEAIDVLLARANCRTARGKVDPAVRDLALKVTQATESLQGRHMESVDVRIVFDHWKRMTGKQHGNVRLSPERRRAIQARLKDGYSVKDIMRAIEGCCKSDFHMARGQYAGGKKYNDLTLILRNGSKLEGFREFADGTVSDISAFL